MSRTQHSGPSTNARRAAPLAAGLLFAAVPLPPLTRPFVTVALPGVEGALVSVDGRGPRDMWFLTDEEIQAGYFAQVGRLIHYDGKRVRDKILPGCSGAAFGGLYVDRDSVRLVGTNLYTRGVSRMTASLSKDGKWGCSFAYSTPITAPDEPAWTLTCGSSEGNDCFLRRADGRTAPLPVRRTSQPGGQDEPAPAWGLRMRGEDEGWMATSDGDGRTLLLRYNGVAWVPEARLDEGADMLGMWIDEEGGAWFTVRLGGSDDDPVIGVRRWDGHALHAVPVPAGFGATLVTGTSARDVWFIGDTRTIYQWDGERLRQGEQPFDVVQGVWAAPGGELWLVGRSEALTAAAKGGASLAVAAHTAPPAEPR